MSLVAAKVSLLFCHVQSCVMKPKINLYTDSYYESLNGTFNDPLSAPIRNYGSASTFIRGCLVLLLRAGFVLVQLGSIPIENVYIILLQNIVDIAVCIASFGLIGYILAFGYDVLNGTVGHGMWIISDSADLDNAILGFSASIIATGIITTILAGRVHFVGYFLTTLFFSMLFQPIIMHWIWHDFGWMHRKNFVGHLVSVKDHAGGLVVHVAGGVVGLIGALFLGRRLMRLSDIDESSIGPESPGSTITGYIFIALGLIAFSLPAPSYELTHIPYNYIGVILVNNIMAMAAGIIVVVILQFLFFRETFNYWIILRCMQGAIAGIVSIASGIDVYTPVLAFAIGAIAAIVFYFVVICVHNSSVEDYCNVIPIHLVCGLLGSMLPPLLGTTENLGTSITSHFRIIHLGWQLLSLTTVSTLMISVFVIHFFVLNLTGFLRNKSEEVNHRRGVTAAVRGPERCFLQRLFTLYPSTPYIEPGSFGKSPEQYHSYKKFDFTTSTTPDREATFQRRAVLSETEPIKTFDVKNNMNNSISFNNTKKSRFTYTMPSIEIPPAEGSLSQRLDLYEGSGDYFKNYQETANKSYTEKLEELATSVGKRFSYYELHRTKKYTNLFRNRLLVRKRDCKVSQESAMSQTSECISYDEKYKDGTQ
ncbi:hypothetical protein ILUMI_00608 [Ignelater luminosus]|uniref:Ammonium transporter AmtB-like domain-containing protein n=1 Tax=Ignelater luminosus TaxID=2038154 RepID=A0A8K0DSA9_IGNLU|nr:hypothetical protein ILUMI_00608 [Ignelater luminosus]